MSADATVRLLILQESEIRKAATLVAEARKLINDCADDDTPLTEAASRALWAAFDSCCIALWGAESTDAMLMLSAHDIVASASIKNTVKPR